MRIPESQIIPSPFFGNYFCLLPAHKAAFITISKCGVTFLKKIAVFLRTGQIFENEDIIHNIVGYNAQSPYLIHLSQMKEYEEKNGELLKFAIWRDPVERIISVYKFFCMEREYRHYFKFLDLYNDNSFERFMKFVDFELTKSKPEYQDEHIRRQSDYYRSEDVDYIIPIRKLNLFLSKKGIPLIEDKTNVTTVKFELPSKIWEERIIELYKDDYQIKTNF